MADQQWPSEDEDFDAVTNGSTATATEPAPAAPKAVKVSMPDDDNEEDSAAADEPAESDSEPEPEQPIAAPKPAPVAAAVTPPTPPQPPRSAVSSGPSHKHPGRTLFEVILVVLVIGLGLWSWVLYNDRSDLRSQVSTLNNNPQVAIQKQTQDLISKVGKLYSLPSGETPTIANVTDAAAAKKQSAFFDNAQNGDKVLMYVKAGEAILYRPSTNKIVLVAPLTFTNSAATATATPSPTPKK